MTYTQGTLIEAGTTPSLDYDVVVVVAGPAGATAAYYTAFAGLKVILLDQQRFPRDKVCGDFVSPGSMRELKKMGIADLEAFKETNVVNQAVTYLNGEARAILYRSHF
jgi:menaquinone-9 beta-reductase